jgi:hypothetical protein
VLQLSALSDESVLDLKFFGSPGVLKESQVGCRGSCYVLEKGKTPQLAQSGVHVDHGALVAKAVYQEVARLSQSQKVTTNKMWSKRLRTMRSDQRASCGTHVELTFSFS